MIYACGYMTRSRKHMQVLGHAKEVMASLPPPAGAVCPTSPPAYAPGSPAAASPAHAEAELAAVGPLSAAGETAGDAAAAKRKAAATPGSPAQVWL